MDTKRYKAVILDMGGVLLPSHFQNFTKEEWNKISTILLSEEFIPKFHAFEVGEISLEEFHPMFQECYYKHHGVHLKRELDAMRHHIIPGRPESTVIPIWYPVLSKLREEGYIIAVLTNNYWIDKAKTGKTTPLDEKHFDAIFESCKLGMRKPNPNIYQHVLNELKLEPEEAIFIDDVIQNLEGASRLGITTIHCTHVDKTIDDLEEILKISLNDKNN